MSPTATARRCLTAVSVAMLTILAGCGGGGGGGSTSGQSCSENARKEFTLAAAREWYLFTDLLPSNVALDEFDDAESLLGYLTATASEQGKDRGFSYLTTPSEDSALLGNGQYYGFGFRTLTDVDNRPFINEVFESGPAVEAGLRRGDEIVAVDSGSGFVPVADLLADGGTISDALGPAEAGVSRGLRLLNGTATREVSMTKRSVTIDPVSDVYGSAVLPLEGTTGVGYLNLRTYISTADSQLRSAFASFRARGIDWFIVDLRYNGGGLVSTAELLNDLLGGARRTSDAQLQVRHNARHAGDNYTRYFNPVPQSVRPVRIAFLTTASTASASEISINAMDPWVEVAIVGANTFGKPVGQLAFDLQGCDTRLRLVSFKTVNAHGEGDYYDGLAGTVPFACAATDTLDRPLGDATEGLTAAAMEWLRTGACGTVMPTEPAARRKGGPGGAGPPRRPASAAEAWIPGIA